MKTKFNVGIDASKFNSTFHTQSADASIVRRDTFGSNAEGFEAMLARFGSLGVDPGRCTVTIEATGLHHVRWCELLVSNGYRVLALNPLITKRLYSANNAIRDSKTDALDAEGICKVGADNAAKLERFLYKSDPQRFGLQRMLSAYKVQRKALTNLKLSAGDLLDFVFPELRARKITLASKGLLRLMLAYPTPERIAALGEANLKGYVGSRCATILELAKASSCSASLARSSAPALQSILQSVESLQLGLEATQQRIEGMLGDCVGAKTQSLARSILGFGAKTTPCILAFIPEGLIEANGKKKATSKIQALFGFDPRKKQSGTYLGKMKISKRGIPIARTALYQCSWAAVLHGDPELKPYYQKLKERGKPHRKAMIDVMRKQLRRLVAVLKDQKTFEYDLT
jgi:transposase